MPKDERRGSIYEFGLLKFSGNFYPLRGGHTYHECQIVLAERKTKSLGSVGINDLDYRCFPQFDGGPTYALSSDLHPGKPELSLTGLTWSDCASQANAANALFASVNPADSLRYICTRETVHRRIIDP